MKLKEILDQLSYGELSQISIGNSSESGVNEENRQIVINHINMGLTELHKRFNLREGRFDIELIPDKFSYVLDMKYAESNTQSNEPNKYIKDSSNPFTNDLFKVERVYDQDGKELDLNNIDNKLAVHTPAYNILVIPDNNDFKATHLTVVYRANHPLISDNASIFPPELVEVDLPMSHLEALLFYVAARVINPMGSSGEFHEGNNYTSKFERAVQQLHQMNYRIDRMADNTRFVRNGWI